MNAKKLRKFFSTIDLHDERSRTWVIRGVLIALAILALAVRRSLIDFQNLDYLIFSNWYDSVKMGGIHSFKDVISNYNPPYTYFLYVVTLIPVSKIVAIKGLMVLFDILLAISVYFIVKIFRPKNYIPEISAIVTMFLPTVLVTGVMWGQFDQLYVAPILLSLYCLLRSNSKWSWIWFGIAIAVKFQAIFFLPVLLILVFKRIRLVDSLWGILAFILLTIPPVFAGRSLGSLVNIYPEQTRIFSGYLTLSAPNIYQWFPNSTFSYLNNAGIVLTAAACACLLLVTMLYRKFSQKEVLLLSTLVLYVVPFLLPAMHERYFFPAATASVVLVFAYPNIRNLIMAVVMQLIVLFSYTPFLFGTAPPISFSIMAVIVLAIIITLTVDYIVTHDETDGATRVKTGRISPRVEVKLNP